MSASVTLAAMSDSHAASELGALENFVVDNDDLLALEERIGRFNIFDALGVARAEVRHSYFLAWLLDPAESHGQGSTFLKAILMDLLRQSPPALRPFSPVELDGQELRGVEVRREWRRIDLLIVCKEPSFVVAIENKVDSGEHGDQLLRYEQTVAEVFSGKPAQFVFLTEDREEASRPNWVSYSYADIYRVLDRVGKTNTGAIGDDVRAFLDHYLRLIGSRFMDDPRIDDLCRMIYKNHRQALDLIFERMGSPGAALLGEIERVVSADAGRWHVINKTTRAVQFLPSSWLTQLPAAGTRATFDPRFWLVLRFEVRANRVFYAASIWPLSNPSLRPILIERLTRDPQEFGFKLFLKKVTSERYTQLGRETLISFDEDEGPDEAAVLHAVQKKLDQLSKRLERVPEELNPIYQDFKGNA